MWASLLSLVMKRRVAQTLMGDGLSTLKAAKNSGTWWFPLLEAVAHRVLVEIKRASGMGCRLLGEKCPSNQAAKIDTEQDLRRNFK